MIATMITIEDGGPGQTSSHGVSRRGLLKIGALGAGGMALTNLLRAAARSGQGSSFKSIINIHLEGGPPQGISATSIILRTPTGHDYSSCPADWRSN